MTAVTTTPIVSLATRGAMADLLAPRADSLAAFLPKGLSVERVIAAAQIAAYNDPNILKCDPKSIFLSVARIAQWGLEIGTTAYLLPFKGKCTPVADYKGLIELVRRSGAARAVTFGVVRVGDCYEVEEGTAPAIKHRPLPGNTADILEFYAVAHHGRDIPPTFVRMTVADVDAIRKAHSKQWAAGALPVWYGVKTVIRRLTKYLPKNALLADALAHIEAEDECDPLDEVLPDAALTARERLGAPTPLRANATPHDPYEIDVPEGVDPATGEDFTP